MPLPKPPATRAAQLSAADFAAQPVAKAKKRVAPVPLVQPVPQAPPVQLVTADVDPVRTPSSTRPSAPTAVAAVAATHGTRSRTPTAPAPLLLAPATNTAATPVAVVASSQHNQPKARSSKKRGSGPAKLFVLDTNVLMHDPMSLFRFDEHDIYLPMITLEELDDHKKGMTEVARNARQVSRDLDALALNMGRRDAARTEGELGQATSDGMTDDIGEGLPLAATGHREAAGKLFFQTSLIDVTLPAGLPQGKADNQILGVVRALREQQAAKPGGKEVVLVSKDINMRIKARALGLLAEDYFNDKTLDDGDLLYTGVLQLPADFWEVHGQTMESWNQGGFTYYRINGPLVPSLMINQFVYLEAPGAASLHAKVTEITGKTAVLRTLREYTHAKNAVWGVTARNREQNFALNLLMDPDCDFITLTGTAGTGKTLLTLAAGLSQVMDDRRYTEIIVTRVTVPVGEDIGFLPGTEEEKMGPWMGALDDNLEVLSKTEGSAGEWGRAATNDLVRSKIKIKSLNFMRGRTFLNKFVLIDEAQNLTPKQMKTLITRAGPGTKIVCLGNLAQIDTPYLTEGSSGLTFAVDRFKGWAHGGHVSLARGERSRLADFASDVL